MWQVNVGGQIYEAPFGELSEWIAEGSLQPQDKVRKGNLRWIDAHKVPYLLPFFNAKANGTAMPPLSAIGGVKESVGKHPDALVHPAESRQAFVSDTPEPEITFRQSDVVPDSQPRLDPTRCRNHSDVVSFYQCSGCGSGLCKACPNSYGGTVKICPACGSLCHTPEDISKARAAGQAVSDSMSEGFGASDLFNAFSHPFNFKTSLIAGAIMFALFSLGQSAFALGGIVMAVAAIFCLMLSNMLTFGVLANTVDNFSQGRLSENFMPGFEDFSLWDDVVHPFFLSIGAYLVSFGPFFVVMAIGFYLVMSAVSSQTNAVQNDLQKIPGTPYYNANDPVAQTGKVKDVLGDISQKSIQTVEQHQNASNFADAAPHVDEESREQEELWAMAQESRQQSLESALGKTAETRAREAEAVRQGFLNLAAPLVVIGAIFFLWGAFYFPAACAVAGYTRSFAATVSPLVGWDTIKRLGLSYAKVLFMGFLIVIGWSFAGAFIGLIFSPFDLPGLGNLPATLVGALVTFYLWTVFSCIIGYALFKNSAKLALPK